MLDIFTADMHAVVKSQPCCFKRYPIQMNHFHLQLHHPAVIHQANQEVLNVMEANGELSKRKTRPAEALGLLGLWPYHILGSVIM